MSNLMIQDLSLTEELGRQAMAAVRGGYGRRHHGKALGLLRQEECDPYEPKPEYEPYGDVRVAQAGVGIFNFNGVGFENGTISITTNGPVTATANA